MSIRFKVLGIETDKSPCVVGEIRKTALFQVGTVMVFAVDKVPGFWESDYSTTWGVALPQGRGNNKQVLRILFGAGNAQGPEMSEMRFRSSLSVWESPYRQGEVSVFDLRQAVHPGEQATTSKSADLSRLRHAHASLHAGRANRSFQMFFLP